MVRVTGLERLARIGFTASVLALQVVYIVSSVIRNRVGFDSAYNLTVPRNLAAGLGYASDGAFQNGQLTPFDVYISTGPTVLAPLAVGFLNDGDGLLTARILMCVPYIALVAGLARVGYLCARGWGASLAVAATLVFDPLGGTGFAEFLGPSDVLGETTAAALLVWSLLALRDRASSVAVSGLLLGLAVLTKTIAAIAAPAILFSLIVICWRREIMGVWMRIVVFSASAALPLVVWQSIILVSLGPSGYIDNLRGQWLFLRGGGSGLETLDTGAAANLVPFLASWYVPIVVVVAAIGGLTLLAGSALGRAGAEKTLASIFGDGRHRSAVLLGLCGIGITWSSWWVFISDKTFTRALYPGAVFLAAAAFSITLIAVGSLAGRRVVVAAAVAMALVAGGASTVTVKRTVFPYPDTQRTQWEIGSAIGDPGDSFAYVGLGDAWAALDAMSVSLANGLHAVPIASADPELRIYIPTAKMSSEDRAGTIAALCGAIVYDRHGVTVCDPSP